MALVAYSDSEGSDTEATPAPAPSKPAPRKTERGPAFQKTEARKIKVDLPAVQSERSEQQEGQPPAKRARTSGAFSGFNSLLPAPKRAAQAGPKPGVSLKTSSEAAFSRAVVEAVDEVRHENYSGANSGGAEGGDLAEKKELEIVGKATRFMPLSVANKKKPMKKARPADESKGGLDGDSDKGAVPSNAETIVKEAEPPPPKPKRSLFSVPHAGDETPVPSTTGDYESITQHALDETQDTTYPPPEQPSTTAPPQAHSNPNTLHSLASDLNLTPAQRRQLFGRNARDSDANINIAHFDMDNEYAANEQLRQAGEVVEHRAVKSIAPGKHSLQQLVNNARSQQDNLEDKWADGRRERGESGRGYGWGR